MADKVWVTFANSAGEHHPGDELEVEVEYAKRLVRDGIANYSTVPDAKAAGDKPEKAVTKQTVK